MDEKNIYKNTDDLLRAKFNGAADMPSSFVWDNIEQKLDKPNRKRRWFLWLIALLSTSILIGVWKFNNLPENVNIKNNSVVENASKDKKIVAEKIQTNTIEQNDTNNSNLKTIKKLTRKNEEKKDDNTLNITDEKTNTVHFNKQKKEVTNTIDDIVKQPYNSTNKTLKTNSIAINNKQKKQKTFQFLSIAQYCTK